VFLNLINKYKYLIINIVYKKDSVWLVYSYIFCFVLSQVLCNT